MNKFFDNFNCAICMSTIKNTHTTKECSHRFCEDCIKECITSLKKCPLCNRYLASHNDIVKDPQFDDLIGKTNCLLNLIKIHLC